MFSFFNIPPAQFQPASRFYSTTEFSSLSKLLNQLIDQETKLKNDVLNIEKKRQAGVSIPDNTVDEKKLRLITAYLEMAANIITAFNQTPTVDTEQDVLEQLRFCCRMIFINEKFFDGEVAAILMTSHSDSNATSSSTASTTTTAEDEADNVAGFPDFSISDTNSLKKAILDFGSYLADMIATPTSFQIINKIRIELKNTISNLCHKIQLKEDDLITCYDFYEILGLSSEASLVDINAAYTQLEFHYNPGRNYNKTSAEMAVINTKYLDIVTAKDTLTNPDKKADYDQKCTSTKSSHFLPRHN